MSKILPATATADGKVFVLGSYQIEDCVILGEGKGPSSGIVILDGLDRTYIPTVTGDIKTTIEKVIAALDEIAPALQAIGGGMTGPTTAPPPTLPTYVASINSVKAELEQLKEALV